MRPPSFICSGDVIGHKFQDHNITDSNDGKHNNGRHSLLSSSLRISSIGRDDDSIFSMINYSSPFMGVDIQKRMNHSQNILDQIMELNQGSNQDTSGAATLSLLSSSLLSFTKESNSSNSNNNTTLSESPLNAYVFAYATLLVCSTKTLLSQTGHVVFLLNKGRI